MAIDPRPMAQMAPETTTYRPDEPGMPPGLLDRILAEAAARIAQAQSERPSPFRLDTWEDVERFAKIAANTDMIPKDYKGKVDNIIIAVLKGKELRIPPLAALDSIAVVNGRPALWGDMIPALCIQSGQVEDFSEEFTGEGEALVARCIVKRRGFSPKLGEFSVGDVRRANLGNVHKLYPRDMMMWRARHRAWRAAFPDVLKGLAVAEIEAEEAARSEWKMPQPAQSWFAPRQAAPADGWDSAWFDAAATKLRSEPNAWDWLALLEGLLSEAPTLRDVVELDKLPVVMDTASKAPVEARAAIDAAFAAARARLAPVGERRVAVPDVTVPSGQEAGADKESLQSTAPQSAGFDALLVDHNSDPISDDSYDDPVAWALAFADELARSLNPAAMAEANADFRADACAVSDRAAKIVQTAIDAIPAGGPPQDDAGNLPVVVPVIERGARPAWGRYSKEIKDALATLPPDRLMDFIAAIREDVETAPGSTRQLIAAAISGYCKGHKIALPEAWLRSLAKPSDSGAAIASPVNAPAAVGEPTRGGEGRADEPHDPDVRAVDNVGLDLEKMTFPSQVDTFRMGTLVQRLRERLTSDGKSDLVARLDGMFDARKAAIKSAPR